MQGAGLGMLLSQMRIKKTQKCQRCGLRYPAADEQCPRCYGLSDAQLVVLKQKIAQQADAHSNLGKWLLLSAVGLISILFLVIFLI
ncbi:MAG: hypothetical protein ACWA5Q_02230 [bacterium]